MTKINWSSGDGEIAEVLNRALDDAVQQMASDLRVVCATLAAR